MVAYKIRHVLVPTDATTVKELRDCQLWQLLPHTAHLGCRSTPSAHANYASLFVDDV